MVKLGRWGELFEGDYANFCTDKIFYDINGLTIEI